MDTDRNPVEVLADEFLTRFRKGECPSVAEYAKQHPEQGIQQAGTDPVSAGIHG